MENISNEQMPVTAQTTEVEVSSGASNSDISLGKFKDTNALLNAYNSLQAEFTKRCQRLKELENLAVEKASAPTKEEGNKENTDSTNFEKEEFLKEYLKGILGSKQKAIILDEGLGVKSPIEKPKTIAEAGRLAKEIL